MKAWDRTQQYFYLTNEKNQQKAKSTRKGYRHERFLASRPTAPTAQLKP